MEGCSCCGQPALCGWLLTAAAADCCCSPSILPAPAPQALLLRRIAVYFDTDAQFWVPEGPWALLPPHEWDEWFQPGIRRERRERGTCCCLACWRASCWWSAANHSSTVPLPPRSSERQERGGTARDRQYVLQPVDGRALYTRRGAGVQAKGAAGAVRLGQKGSSLPTLFIPCRIASRCCPDSSSLPACHPLSLHSAEEEPVVEIDVQLDVVAVRLSRASQHTCRCCPRLHCACHSLPADGSLLA